MSFLGENNGMVREVVFDSWTRTLATLASWWVVIFQVWQWREIRDDYR
jgi:hypothetical protein